MSDVARTYFERVIGHALERSTPVLLSPDDVLEAAWPLNELMRSVAPRVAGLPYDAAHEAAADAAIVADPSGAAWAALPDSVLRVLQERHRQLLLLASANKAANARSMTAIPHDLPSTHRLAAVTLLLMHSMRALEPLSGNPAPSSAAPSPGRKK